MTIPMPAPIAAYFAADAKDGAAIARCFAPDAVVSDERNTHVGREAIARWAFEAATKYDFVSEPIGTAQDDALVVVTSRVTGTFPGSPIDLRYKFTVDGDVIARLEIAP
ncbi:ketosteroid isomerase-like protein [Constrictibacter sp. MBR-5]|jgi:ketosteroid isomerase-like protein|uniref:nuclear transport factor 2 family protein n=1 Tax=Constrictibacter sp. MBR-5 TaxID=3156467 RepID=UPI0033911930